MKVISSKTGSSRERVDAEADLLNVANWRPIWATNTGGHGLVANGRTLVLSSRWGSERNTELHLTEAEAIAVAKAVTEGLFSAATLRANETMTAPQPAQTPVSREPSSSPAPASAGGRP